MRPGAALLTLGLAAMGPVHAQSGCGEGAGPEISVTNLSRNETVGYELLLIKGDLAVTAEKVYLDLDGIPPGFPGSPSVEPDESAAAKPVREWPAGGGHFKALVQLAKGPNHIVLSAEGHRTTCLDVNYSPNPSRNTIRLVFVLSKDGMEGPGVIPAAPGDISDLISAKKRLAFGALLMETAMAELLHDAGRPRRTVSFKRDSRGHVEVTVFHSARSEDSLRAKTADQLWEVFHRELDSAYQDGRTKFLSMLGGFGSGALGGGNQAMFGTATLYSWAQGLDELTSRFSDPRKPGDFNLVDESAFRNSFWSNYSTGIGATLHELGHALGLPHSGDGDDIMERGFDRFNRIFMIREDDQLITDQAAHYGPSSADLLLNNAWVLPAAPAGLAAREARVDYRLGRAGNRLALSMPGPGTVSLELYSPSGAKAATVFRGVLARGEHFFALPRLAPGIYFCAARADGRTDRNGGTALARILIP
ncbi:MAG: hypothetical protein JWO30_1449 [Fibrobacteres bacterium]|nr:hypothetical protein [Fibrobacterota bacterium]